MKETHFGSARFSISAGTLAFRDMCAESKAMARIYGRNSLEGGEVHGRILASCPRL